MKRLILGKVHISSTLPMREDLRVLEKTLKIIKKCSNVIEKTEVRKRRPSETVFSCLGTHFGGILWESRQRCIQCGPPLGPTATGGGAPPLPPPLEAPAQVLRDLKLKSKFLQCM